MFIGEKIQGRLLDQRHWVSGITTRWQSKLISLSLSLSLKSISSFTPKIRLYPYHRFRQSISYNYTKIVVQYISSVFRPFRILLLLLLFFLIFLNKECKSDMLKFETNSNWKLIIIIYRRSIILAFHIISLVKFNNSKKY